MSYYAYLNSNHLKYVNNLTIADTFKHFRNIIETRNAKYYFLNATTVVNIVSLQYSVCLQHTETNRTRSTGSLFIRCKLFILLQLKPLPPYILRWCVVLVSYSVLKQFLMKKWEKYSYYYIPVILRYKCHCD